MRSMVGVLTLFVLLAPAAGASAQPPDGADVEPPPPGDGDTGAMDEGGDEAAEPDPMAAEQAAMETDTEEPAPDSGAAPLERVGDEQVLTEEQLGVEVARSSTDPWEDPEQAYYFLGATYRHNFIPSFILELFMDDATPANNPNIGAEFIYRRDGFDIAAGISYSQYYVDGPFRASGDPETDIEFFDSNLAAVFGTVTFLWSTEFNDIFALQYGLGLGVGVTFGDMIRAEAYPNRGGTDGNRAVRGFSECAGPGRRLPADAYNANDPYCGPTTAQGDPMRDPGLPPAPGTTDLDGEEGEHYFTPARKWSGGGSVPNAWFRASLPHIALRIKPIAQLLMRVDFGFDLFSGFFVGAGIFVGL